MGACLGKGKKKKSGGTDTIDRRAQKNPSTSSSTSIPVIQSPNEILDERLKKEINDILQETAVSISKNYEAERERIVAQMERSAPERYLGLDFKDYPDVNGRTVNEMARKQVTSPEAKQKTFDEVEQRIAPSFQSRTAQMEEPDCDEARSIVRTYIEGKVQDIYTNVELN